MKRWSRWIWLWGMLVSLILTQAAYAHNDAIDAPASPNTHFERLMWRDGFSSGYDLENADSLSDDSVWKVIITPPWWAWALGGLALLGLLFAGHRWRMYAMQQRSRALEREVAARTQELHDSEQRYRLLAENMADVVWTLDNESNFTYISPSITKLRGLTPEEAMQETIEETMTPESLQTVQVMAQRQTEANRRRDRDYVSHFEIEQYCKDGSTVWVDCVTQALYGDQGEHLGMLGVSRDISARKREEAKLRESEERFAAVMNSIEALIYVADLESYEILFLNAYGRARFGEVVGETCWQVLQADMDGPCDFCTNPHLVKDGQPAGLYSWEFQNTRTGQWYNIQDQAIHWIDGRLVRLEVATDITEIKQIEAHKRRLATLEERERIGRELHDDLGQTLAYMYVQAQTVLTLLDQGHQAQAEAALAQLARTAQEAQQDVRQYILGVRKTQGHGDFFALLENYASMLEQRYGLKTCFNWPEGLTIQPFAARVETPLLQVIQEALTNVAKHAGVDTVRVTLRLLGEHTATISVEDQGCGFDLAQNIEAGQDAASSPHFGLQLMHERVAALGGRLEIDTHPGRGTQVMIQAPRLIPLTGDFEGASGRSPRILLVDDHLLFLEGLKNMLDAHGAQVVGLAQDGLEAQALAQELRPDVILMDVHMPRCDGIEATQHILAHYPEIKIVMLSVSAEEETLLAALESGASGYLLKDLDSHTLFNMLSDLMQGQTVIAPTLAAQMPPAFVHAGPGAKEEHIEKYNPVEIKAETDLAHQLTPRQAEILQHVAQGLTYKETGDALEISERTVKYHMGQILERLELKNHAQAIAYALQKEEEALEDKE